MSRGPEQRLVLFSTSGQCIRGHSDGALGDDEPGLFRNSPLVVGPFGGRDNKLRHSRGVKVSFCQPGPPEPRGFDGADGELKAGGHLNPTGLPQFALSPLLQRMTHFPEQLDHVGLMRTLTFAPRQPVVEGLTRRRPSCRGDNAASTEPGPCRSDADRCQLAQECLLPRGERQPAALSRRKRGDKRPPPSPPTLCPGGDVPAPSPD